MMVPGSPGITTINSHRLCFAIIVIAALIGTLSSLEIVYHFGDGAFRNDYFRHFKLVVIPIMEGSGNLSNLFHNHHASPLMHFHQIFSSYALDSSLLVDAYVGITLLFVVAVYLGLTAFQELSLHTGSLVYALIIAILIALLITGLTAARLISWPLIYLQGYFLTLGLLVSVSTYFLCTRPDRGSSVILYVCSVALAVILHSSFGMLFFFASVPAIAIRVISQRSFKLIAALLITVTLVYVWNSIALPALGHQETYRANIVRYFTARFTEIPLMVTAFGKTVATGFHGDAYTFDVREGTLSARYMVGFFCIAMAYAGATLWALLKQRKVLIAGVIMLAILLGALGALLSRGGSTFPYKLDAPRYILQYKFAAAAFIWSAADALVSLFRVAAPRINRGTRNFLLTVIALILLGSIIMLQTTAFGVISQKKPFFTNTQGENDLAVYMLGVDTTNTYSLFKWYAGFNLPEVYDPVIDWLSREKANVFSRSYRGSEHLINYIQARDIYQSTTESPILLPIDQKNCLRHTGFTRAQVWNVKLESAVNGRFTLVFDASEKATLLYPVRIGTQSIYGAVPSGTPFHLCFPENVTVKYFTHLPAAAPG